VRRLIGLALKLVDGRAVNRTARRTGGCRASPRRRPLPVPAGLR